MTRSARIDQPWADGRHVFRLGIDQLAELQEKCDAGPPFVLARLMQNAWRVEDVRETLRLGLIGGGLASRDAMKLIERYVDAQKEVQLAENALIAQAVLGAAIFGHEDEPPKKPAGEGDAARTSPAANTAGASSTPPAPPSA